MSSKLGIVVGSILGLMGMMSGVGGCESSPDAVDAEPVAEAGGGSPERAASPADRPATTVGRSEAAPEAPAAPDWVQLADWMTGWFSSARQAADDPEHPYPIRMVGARIWTERDNGAWLYMEQALEESPSEPYRQWIYRIADDAGMIRIDVYTFKEDPRGFAQPWERGMSVFNRLGLEDVTRRSGCSIYVTRSVDGRFVGGTDEGTCLTSLNGASYVTSEMSVSATRVTMWDRGYNESGRQVYGPVRGPLVFMMQGNGFPPASPTSG